MSVTTNKAWGSCQLCKCRLTHIHRASRQNTTWLGVSCWQVPGCCRGRQSCWHPDLGAVTAHTLPLLWGVPAMNLVPAHSTQGWQQDTMLVFLAGPAHAASQLTSSRTPRNTGWALVATALLAANTACCMQAHMAHAVPLWHVALAGRNGPCDHHTGHQL
jgi:hypothetical protein